MDYDIIAITRENTKSGKAMWRMGTRGGDAVYVFDESRAILSEYPEILASNLHDTLYWDINPIVVNTMRDGKGWLKINTVSPRTALSVPNLRAVNFDSHWVLNLYKSPFFIIDTETTGKDYDSKIVSIGLVNGVTGSQHKWMVNPQMLIPQEATDIHKITDEMVSAAPSFGRIAQEMLSIIGESRLVAYNSTFDQERLNYAFRYSDINLPSGEAYTLSIDCVMRAYANGGKWCKLSESVSQMGVEWGVELSAHDALSDSIVTLKLLNAMRNKASDNLSI